MGLERLRVQLGHAMRGSRWTSRVIISADEPPGPRTRPARTVVTGIPVLASASSTSCLDLRWAETSPDGTIPPR